MVSVMLSGCAHRMATELDDGTGRRPVTVFAEDSGQPVYLRNLRAGEPYFSDPEQFKESVTLFTVEGLIEALFEGIPSLHNPFGLTYRPRPEPKVIASSQIPPNTKPKAKATPLAYDLVDRIRDGFRLDLTIDNPRIRAQLNWFVRNPDYLDRCFNRSARYLYHVVTEIEKRGMPMELALLPIVESAYDPFAYSHSHASGLWQFIPGTAKIYGLPQSWWYDARRDVLASTDAALRYFSYLSTKFDGNWLYSVASYNAGSGRITQAVEHNLSQGLPIDFWSLRLPQETMAYVPKLLALAKIVAHPEKYGITLPRVANEPYFAVVNIDSQLELAQAAQLAQVDVNEIYLLNPGYNQWATDPLGPHRLLVPIDKARTFQQNLAALSPAERLAWNRYTVQRGDTLIAIARKFHTTPDVIQNVNRLNSHIIHQNQRLLIPVTAKQVAFNELSPNRRINQQPRLQSMPGQKLITYTVQHGDTMWQLAKRHNVALNTLAGWNNMTPNDVLIPGRKLNIWSQADSGTRAKPATQALAQQRQMIKKVGYMVRKGDSLIMIANKFSVSVKDLIVWNNLDQRKHIQPGQKLTIFVDVSNS